MPGEIFQEASHVTERTKNTFLPGKPVPGLMLVRTQTNSAATARTDFTGTNSLKNALQRKTVDASMKINTMKTAKPLQLIVHRE